MNVLKVFIMFLFVPTVFSTSRFRDMLRVQPSRAQILRTGYPRPWPDTILPYAHRMMLRRLPKFILMKNMMELDCLKDIYFRSHQVLSRSRINSGQRAREFVRPESTSGSIMRPKLWFPTRREEYRKQRPSINRLVNKPIFRRNEPQKKRFYYQPIDQNRERSNFNFSRFYEWKMKQRFQKTNLNQKNDERILNIKDTEKKIGQNEDKTVFKQDGFVIINEKQKEHKDEEIYNEKKVVVINENQRGNQDEKIKKQKENPEENIIKQKEKYEKNIIKQKENNEENITKQKGNIDEKITKQKEKDDEKIIKYKENEEETPVKEKNYKIHEKIQSEQQQMNQKEEESTAKAQENEKVFKQLEKKIKQKIKEKVLKKNSTDVKKTTLKPEEKLKNTQIITEIKQNTKKPLETVTTVKIDVQLTTEKPKKEDTKEVIPYTYELVPDRWRNRPKHPKKNYKLPESGKKETEKKSEVKKPEIQKNSELRKSKNETKVQQSEDPNLPDLPELSLFSDSFHKLWQPMKPIQPYEVKETLENDLDSYADNTNVEPTNMKKINDSINTILKGLTDKKPQTESFNKGNAESGKQKWSSWTDTTHNLKEITSKKSVETGNKLFSSTEVPNDLKESPSTESKKGSKNWSHWTKPPKKNKDKSSSTPATFLKTFTNYLFGKTQQESTPNSHHFTRTPSNRYNNWRQSTTETAVAQQNPRNLKFPPPDATEKMEIPTFVFDDTSNLSDQFEEEPEEDHFDFYGGINLPDREKELMVEAVESKGRTKTPAKTETVFSTRGRFEVSSTPTYSIKTVSKQKKVEHGTSDLTKIVPVSSVKTSKNFPKTPSTETLVSSPSISQLQTVKPTLETTLSQKGTTREGITTDDFVLVGLLPFSTTPQDQNWKNSRKIKFTEDPLSNQLADIKSRRSDIMINENSDYYNDGSLEKSSDYKNLLKTSDSKELQLNFATNITVDSLAKFMPDIISDLKEGTITSEEYKMLSKIFGKHWDPILSLANTTNVDMLPLLKIKDENDLAMMLHTMPLKKKESSQNISEYDFIEEYRDLLGDVLGEEVDKKNNKLKIRSKRDENESMKSEATREYFDSLEEEQRQKQQQSENNNYYTYEDMLYDWAEENNPSDFELMEMADYKINYTNLTSRTKV